MKLSVLGIKLALACGVTSAALGQAPSNPGDRGNRPDGLGVIGGATNATPGGTTPGNLPAGNLPTGNPPAGEVKAPDPVPDQSTDASDSPVVTVRPSSTRSAEASAISVPEVSLPPGLVLTDDLRSIVNNFRTQAQSFIDQQNDVMKQYRGATVEDRERLKLQLKANREGFLEQTRELRSELKQRASELRRDLKDARPLDAGLSEGGAGRRRGAND